MTSLNGGDNPAQRLAVQSCQTTGKDFGREALKDLPDGKLVEIAESGHVSHIEKPDEFDAALTAFLTTRFR